MTVAFLVNKHSTYVWRALSHEFTAAGVRVLWISPSKRWSATLTADGVAPGDILSLPDLKARWEALDEQSARLSLARWRRPGWPELADTLLMDRNLRRMEKATATAYLAVVADAVAAFMTERGVRHTVGETTWAWEVVAHQVCAAVGGIPLWPQTLRLPGDRWGLFEPVSHRLIGDLPASEEDQAWAAEFIANFRARPAPPNYFGKAPSALKVRDYWRDELRRALFSRDEGVGDLTFPRLTDRILGRLGMAWNTLRIRRAKIFSDDPGDGRRFVLFTLHHQPESAIDVMGSIHSDQAATLERLARLLPADCELWVKEHPDAIGDRSLGWLRRIAHLPGVRLINPRLSTLELMRRADLVVGISGTVVYEAALLGVPCAMTAPLYFSPMVDAGPAPGGGTVDPLSWPWDRLLSGDLSRAAADPAVAQARLARATRTLASMRANSWPGRFDILLRGSTSGQIDPTATKDVAAGHLDFFRRVGTLS